MDNPYLNQGTPGASALFDGLGCVVFMLIIGLGCVIFGDTEKAPRQNDEPVKITTQKTIVSQIPDEKQKHVAPKGLQPSATTKSNQNKSIHTHATDCNHIIKVDVHVPNNQKPSFFWGIDMFGRHFFFPGLLMLLSFLLGVWWSSRKQFNGSSE